MNLLFDIL